ncbi:MAG TPA: hypothetical protein PK867_05775 [Pirellulales bacterium]|nr:hypothetical protein [Pirellulales bacterium]
MIVTYGVIGVQVHDARLSALMTRRGIAQILTLNPRDFARYATITAITPGDVIAASP